MRSPTASPHRRMQPKSRSKYSSSRDRGQSGVSFGQVLVAIFFGGFSYYIGFSFGVNSFLNCGDNDHQILRDSTEHMNEHDLIDHLVEQRVKAALSEQTEDKITTTNTKKIMFPKTMSDFANGIVKVSQTEFLEKFDNGTPQPLVARGAEEAIIIYNSEKSIPETAKQLLDKSDGAIPTLRVDEAVANCDSMNVIYQNPEYQTSRCMAIVGNYENYYIQKWLKLNKDSSSSSSSSSLTPVGYTVHNRNGANHFEPPRKRNLDRHVQIFQQYLESHESFIAILKPILEKIVVDNTIIIMTTNSGQADLMANFVCSANRNGFNIQNVLVFATDEKSHEMARGLGLESFYNEKLFGILESREARHYGDRAFADMMYAKVICVQLVNMMGYDVLFQDVDVVWYKHPLAYLAHDDAFQSHDMVYQDDGSRHLRFGPSSANSGFYYVRSNPLTRYFFISLLYSGDLILGVGSHQQVLSEKINEFSSLYGLRVKILSGKEFPCGMHYHRQKDMMRHIVEKELHPYIFHMSWTNNKEDKIKFFKQMGLWYLEDQCIGEQAFDAFTQSTVEGNKDDMVNEHIEKCCAAEALVSCHYRDKPSIIPCRDSPPIDAGRPSFWKK